MNIYESNYCQDKIFYGYEYLRSFNSKFGNVGTPYYVGKGKGFRFRVKHHVGISVPKDKRKICCTNLMNEADSFQWEILQIYLNGRIDLGTGCLRNRTCGGEGGSFHLGRVAWNKGIPRTPEEKRKMSISKLGKKTGRTAADITKEWKENISAAAKARNKWVGCNNPQFGGPSQEVRTKISNTRKQRASDPNWNIRPVCSKEKANKIRKANLGKRWVHNIDLCKRKYISPSELENFLFLGWKEGIGKFSKLS
jgi:hypothetical protein